MFLSPSANATMPPPLLHQSAMGGISYGLSENLPSANDEVEKLLDRNAEAYAVLEQSQDRQLDDGSNAAAITSVTI